MANGKKRKIITLADGTQVKAGSAVAKAKSRKKRVVARDAEVAAARRKIATSGDLRARVRAKQKEATESGKSKPQPDRKRDPEVSQTDKTGPEHRASGESGTLAAANKGLRQRRKDAEAAKKKRKP